MSRIFKKNDINIDDDNKVVIRHRNLPESIIMNVTSNDANNTKSLSIDEANQKAKSILEKAKKEAIEVRRVAQEISDKMIEETTKKQTEFYDQAKENGYDDGFQEGYEQGKVDGENTFNDMIKLKEMEIEQIREEKLNLISEVEADTVNLIIDIIGNLTYNAFEIKPELLSVLVKRGISNATIKSKVSIKVSSEDYDNVISHKDEFTKLVDSSKEVEILKDFSLMKNDCMLETEYGNINCGLDEQLQSIKESLYFILKEK